MAVVEPGPVDVTDEVIVAASRLARGWRVIRIDYRAKNPARIGWENERETPESVLRWQTPCNMGVVLGNVSSGLTDIDLDCPEAIVAARHLLPATAARFGRRSNPESHYLYYCRDLRTTKRTDVDSGANGKQVTLAELRSNSAKLKPGSQTIIPPSTHEDTGERIEWCDGYRSGPAKVTPDELQAAYNLLCAASLIARHFPGEGARHDTSLALGGFLANAGMPCETALIFCRAVFDAAAADIEHHLRNVKDSYAKHAKGEAVVGASGLRERLTGSADKVLDLVCKWLSLKREQRHLRAVDAQEAVYSGESRELNEIRTFRNIEFPLAVFPPTIGEFVTSVARFLGVNQNMVAMATLGALAVAGQRRLRIETLPNVWRPMVLQIIIFARSGERKSPVFDEVTRPIYDYQREQRENHDARVKALQGDIALAKQADDPQRAADLQRELDELPPPFRTVMQDVTPEMAVRLMADNEESMALVSDDGKLLENFIGRYRSGVDQLDIVLKGWDAKPYWYDRVNAGTKVLNEPKLGALLATQYETLRDLMDPRKPFRSRGAMARILPYVAPPRTEPRDVLRGPPIPSALRDEYARVMRNLMSGAPMDALRPDASGDISANVFDVFEPEFHESLRHERESDQPPAIEDYSPRVLREKEPNTENLWFDKVLTYAEVEALPEGSGAGMPDWLAKWADNCARAIGLLEYIGGAKDLRDCFRLCGFLMFEARRALLQPGAVAPEDGTLSERCMELLNKVKELAENEKKTKFTCREVLRAFRKVGSIQKLVELLERLDEHNYLTLEEPARGTRRQSKYIISLHTSPTK